MNAVDLASAHQLPTALARTKMSQGKGLDALRTVEVHRRMMEAEFRIQDALKAKVVQVIIHHTSGHVDKALNLLRECIKQAQPQGSIRLFVDEGDPMKTLLSQLSHETATAPYVSQLLRAFGTRVTQEKRVDVPAAASSSHLPLGAFSDRELEILRLIQKGHSNQTIGELLFVSLSTIKWHNQNIFAKLDVQRRTEAVARAVQLKLL